MIYFILYVLSILLANLTAGTILTLGTLQFALGTVFFGAVFTLRDYIHNNLGKKYAYIAIGAAILLSLLLSIIGAVPIRIIIASLLGILIAESTDTEIYHSLKNKNQVTRILTSNIVSIPLDTLIFTLIAFYGVWAMELIISVIIGDIVIKLLISILMIGLKYVRLSRSNAKFA